MGDLNSVILIMAVSTFLIYIGYLMGSASRMSPRVLYRLRGELKPGQNMSVCENHHFMLSKSGEDDDDDSDEESSPVDLLDEAFRRN
jgi:hypothetical protein